MGESLKYLVVNMLSIPFSLFLSLSLFLLAEKVERRSEDMCDVQTPQKRLAGM
jgi:hypothetical protein